MKTILNIKGMHCHSCKALIEEVCGDIPGVRTCIVDVGREKAEIDHDDNVDIGIVKKEIEGFGDYHVEISI